MLSGRFSVVAVAGYIKIDFCPRPKEVRHDLLEIIAPKDSRTSGFRQST
jgi:hypothetical protein